MIFMISSFGNKLTENLYDDRRTIDTRKIPQELRRTVRRKILFLHDSEELSDLKVAKGHRFENLKGNWMGYHSIRVNNKWRLVFQLKDGRAYNVQMSQMSQMSQMRRK